MDTAWELVLMKQDGNGCINMSTASETTRGPMPVLTITENYPRQLKITIDNSSVFPTLNYLDATFAGWSNSETGPIRIGDKVVFYQYPTNTDTRTRTFFGEICRIRPGAGCNLEITANDMLGRVENVRMSKTAFSSYRDNADATIALTGEYALVDESVYLIDPSDAADITTMTIKRSDITNVPIADDTSITTYETISNGGQVRQYFVADGDGIASILFRFKLLNTVLLAPVDIEDAHIRFSIHDVVTDRVVFPANDDGYLESSDIDYADAGGAAKEDNIIFNRWVDGPADNVTNVLPIELVKDKMYYMKITSDYVHANQLVQVKIIKYDSGNDWKTQYYVYDNGTDAAVITAARGVDGWISWINYEQISDFFVNPTYGYIVIGSDRTSTDVDVTNGHQYNADDFLNSDNDFDIIYPRCKMSYYYDTITTAQAFESLLRASGCGIKDSVDSSLDSTLYAVSASGDTLGNVLRKLADVYQESTATYAGYQCTIAHRDLVFSGTITTITTGEVYKYNVADATLDATFGTLHDNAYIYNRTKNVWDFADIIDDDTFELDGDILYAVDDVVELWNPIIYVAKRKSVADTATFTFSHNDFVDSSPDEVRISDRNLEMSAMAKPYRVIVQGKKPNGEPIVVTRTIEGDGETTWGDALGTQMETIIIKDDSLQSLSVCNDAAFAEIAKLKRGTFSGDVTIAGYYPTAFSTTGGGEIIALNIPYLGISTDNTDGGKFKVKAVTITNGKTTMTLTNYDPTISNKFTYTHTWQMATQSLRPEITDGATVYKFVRTSTAIDTSEPMYLELFLADGMTRVLGLDGEVACTSVYTNPYVDNPTTGYVQATIGPEYGRTEMGSPITYITLNYYDGDTLTQRHSYNLYPGDAAASDETFYKWLNQTLIIECAFEIASS